MGKILGRNYSDTRENKNGEIEYFIDGDWYTKKDVAEENKEIIYWHNWTYEVYADGDFPQ
ncbi:hypothetical protein Bcop_1274 [Bacteroides coprosuis DSM 18011]|uniref:Uncharacterized protein n=1 Tax=Bacteroides coprosuis DSM 18011 TaxID=679937 RepID=F3ZND6_9BACE|nr:MULTISPECIES: hypothetical protein [Bacteroides]EGJ71476.1 hypothetical protein Bcop_1274 [Bacteroides coprosuis DSM 18011]HJD91747.1 hypothetical protein [Bacteroides coprosuis]